jgi:hypothetical protein
MGNPRQIREAFAEDSTGLRTATHPKPRSTAVYSKLPTRGVRAREVYDDDGCDDG